MHWKAVHLYRVELKDANKFGEGILHTKKTYERVSGNI
jgi:hypothetical protein